MTQCSTILYLSCLLVFIGVVCAAPAGVLSDDKFSVLENRETRSICSEWYDRLNYAIWKHVCGHSKTPHEFVRRFDPSNIRNSPVANMDIDDEIRSEDWDRLKELLLQFRRPARDGGAQFETPMYII